MSQTVDRRAFLRGTGALSAGAAVADVAVAQPASSPKRFRIAHLTDSHVQPERGATDGTRMAFRHAQEHHAPDLIVAGGDQIMDALAKPADRVQLQFNLWNQIVKDEWKVPIKHVIGNHDVWGWGDHAKSGTTGNEPRYGKAWACEAWGMSEPYYGFDQNGWRVIVLDSTQFDGGGAYVASLDEPQFDWLAAELAALDAKTPVCIFSHIPILGVVPFLFDDKLPSTQGVFAKPRFGISRALMHVDFRRIKDLFEKHPNVKLCVSGHIHMNDRVEYLGVTYVSNPAVSGSWWHGPKNEFDNGYGIVDLFSDGTFTTSKATYGWVKREA